MSSSNKRHSILPPLKDSGPKAPVRFSSSLIIAESAILTGTHIITLRTESLVHPRAKIESTAGPVDVGKRCIVQERTHVGAVPSGVVVPASPGAETAGDNTAGVVLHDYVTIQACAVVEAGGTVVGEGSVIGVGAKIGRGAVIGEVRLETSFILLSAFQAMLFIVTDAACVIVLHDISANYHCLWHQDSRIHCRVLPGQPATRQAGCERYPQEAAGAPARNPAKADSEQSSQIWMRLRSFVNDTTRQSRIKATWLLRAAGTRFLHRPAIANFFRPRLGLHELLRESKRFFPPSMLEHYIRRSRFIEHRAL